MQSKTNPEFKGVADCVVKTVKNNGVLGLYRGKRHALLVAEAILVLSMCYSAVQGLGR